jgi:hypothetical protein
VSLQGGLKGRALHSEFHETGSIMSIFYNYKAERADGHAQFDNTVLFPET